MSPRKMWRGRGGGGAPPEGWYASPTGSATGAGTYADPWTLHQAYNLGGYPTGTIQAGDTVWLRGGTYVTPMTTANMQGTSISNVMAFRTNRKVTSSDNPWVAGDVGKSITVYGAGVNGADLSTTVQAVVSAWQITLASEISTPTQFCCSLVGTVAEPITFRNYPGERAIIDGNFDSTICGAGSSVITPYSAGFAQILRGIEIMNSNTVNDRVLVPDSADSRGEGVSLLCPHAKVINCIIHDNAQGVGNWSNGKGAEVSGCLIYYNGEYAPYCERNSGVAVDLVDNGTAVALSGSSSGVDNPAAISPTALEFSHNHSGNYLLVGAYVAVDEAGVESDLSATYDGVSMTRISGTHYQGNYTGGSVVAMFGLATTNTGSHTVAISYANDGHPIRGRAQSFSNVASASAGGIWNANRYDSTPLSANTTSATNHMVVDVCGIYNAYWEVQDYATYGDNAGNMIGGSVGGNNPVVRLSWASGKASVSMGWNWSRVLYGHGHGMYGQNGVEHNDVTMNIGTQTVTVPSGAPWSSVDLDSRIVIEGAGPAGADLLTTITGINSSTSITVQATASTQVTGGTAYWALEKKVCDNIFLDQVAYGTQLYGSSGAHFLDGDISGNLWVYSGPVFGGLSGFRMTDTVFAENYSWEAGTNLGYSMDHMTNVEYIDNYCHRNLKLPSPSTKWEDMVVGTSGHENTVIGTTENWSSTDFPDNTFYAGPPYPTTNVVVVRPNAYEANRANIYVYNWESLTNVSVDLTGAVANGTAVYIMNAQNYFSTPVWSGTYTGGTVSLPMTGLTKAAGVAYDEQPWTGQGFNCFIVRAQSEETWR